ncbi:hypothetical protein T492DRAFT_901694 [Pavlovales sp. CCMP2436]|nr:hypothetical protein T492DRAFT_901694 [Pavlovales sp. CCMP2436]
MAAAADKAKPDEEKATPEARAAPDEEDGQQDTYAPPKLPMDGMSDCFFISSLAVFIFGSFALSLTFAMLIIHGLIDPIMDEYTKTHNITRGASRLGPGARSYASSGGDSPGTFGVQARKLAADQLERTGALTGRPAA